MVSEISARELSDKLNSPTPPVLIDVREPQEFSIANIRTGQLKPLGQIMTWVNELDPQTEIVLYCHSGRRSAQATAFLKSRGFNKVFNLRGGIDAWSTQVDPSVPRY